MPQKKNPDVPELARGKTGRVNGHLMALLTLMKGQPLAYNKDNQEDKEPLFDTVDTVADTLRIFAEMVAGIAVKPQAMRAAALQGFSTATDLADYLVKRGLPFRDAHEAVAHAVRICVDRDCDLADLSLEDMRSELPNVGPPDRRRCVRLSDARGIGGEPQSSWRNCASASARSGQGRARRAQVISSKRNNFRRPVLLKCGLRVHRSPHRPLPADSKSHL